MTLSGTRWLKTLVLCGLLPAVAMGELISPPDPIDPNEGLFSDEWAEIHLGGGKVGYMHSTMRREGNRIITRMVTVMKMGRVDSPVQIRTDQLTTETVSGTPIEFSSEMHAATMKTTTRGEVKQGRVHITTSQFGMEQQQQFDFPTGALMTWGLYRETLVRGFTPGTEYTLDVYAPEMRMDEAVQADTIIGDWESFKHGDRTLRGQLMTVTMSSVIGEVTVTSWVDKHGRPLKAIMPAAGLGNITIFSTDQQTALSNFVPPEIFMRTTIKAPRKIDRHATDQIVYRLRKKNPDVVLTGLPVTGMQKIAREKNDSVELVVSRQSHKHHRRNTRGLPNHELREFLESNLMINTDDPKLIELAKKAGGHEKNPYKLGDKLRRFVTEYINDKNLNVGFATASEVARTREGDCSEHGVLLAALGRLNGLPSRVVVGVAYVPLFGNASDIFGYHLWTQFYIDGEWVDFDAALRESECSPARIAFATSSLRNTGLADLSLPLLSIIGSIELDILDLKESNSHDH